MVATVAAVMTQPESRSFLACSGLHPLLIKSASFTRARSVSSETPSSESALRVSFVSSLAAAAVAVVVTALTWRWH